MEANRIHLLLGVLLLAVGGCNVDLGDKIGGSEETRNLSGFTGVNNKSDADVELKTDGSGDGLDAGDVLVSCSGDLVATVATSVNADGYLIIDFAAEVASVLDCSITVVTEDVTDVVADGDGDIICHDPMTGVRTIEVNGNGSVVLASVEADELNILVTGNGSVEIDQVTVDQLNIDLRGTGDASLAGAAGRVDLLISGSGDLAAKDLVAGYLHALLNGTGSAAITVDGIVDAEVIGDATLDVYGAAETGDVVETDGGLVNFN